MAFADGLAGMRAQRRGVWTGELQNIVILRVKERLYRMKAEPTEKL